ncbi:MAG TPA: ABC transporter substrate-binding protein [Acidimicrobiales bacterium]
MAAVVLASTLLAACTSDASTRAGGESTDEGAGGSTTTAPQVTAPDPEDIPPGTTLRVGDQIEFLQTMLEVAGEDRDFPYEVEYSSFQGGPPMLQAFQGGAVDTGFVASTPLIFAQAQDQDLFAIAGWAADHSNFSLVTAPGVDIDGWEDLAGKRVAYTRGTAMEGALLQAIDEAGVSPDEIETIDIAITGATAALEAGSADAAISVEPFTTMYLADNPDARVAAEAPEITDRSQFLIASRRTIDDEAKLAALADYTLRLVRAFAYVREHPDEVAQAIYVERYGLPPERAAEVARTQGVASFIELPGDIVEQQQELADLYAEAGQIPHTVDVTAEFDTRLNEIILAEQERVTEEGS